jgi:hypothetical protein
MGQCRKRVEGAVAPQLDPDLAADVAADRALEAAAIMVLDKRFHAFAAAAVEFAQAEAVAFDQAHHAWGHQFAGRVDHAADEAFGFNVPRDQATRVQAVQAAAFKRADQLVEVPPGHTVDHGHHAGLRAEQATQVGQQVLHLVRLHGQQHHVLFTRVGVTFHGAQRGSRR